MVRLDEGILAAMVRRGMSRRAFLEFSAAMAAALALPLSQAPRIAAAVESARRLPVIWLRGQACSGNSAALLRSSEPTVAELLLDLLSVDYDEQLMAPAGAVTGKAIDALTAARSEYLLVVEGSIPTGADGAFCLVGGRPVQDIVREVGAGAAAVIALGSCAVDGGLAAAAGGPTGATGIASLVPGDRLVCLPGCPANVDNVVLTIVHYLTTKELPPTDARRRPLFAYGGLIHNQCERRAHFEFGEFVTEWGSEGAQKDWCLYKMGCKGPETYANCPTQRYASGTSWPVKAGHGCIGCTMPGFWDSNSPFYRRLPDPLPFVPGLTVDNIGQLMIGAVVGVTALHGTVTFTSGKVGGALARRRARRAIDTPAPEPGTAGYPALSATLGSEGD
jgi:hydrogenase small subunit